ncbi:MAG TPA: hypothetical protein VGI92_03795, partial [Gemmatimonadales bacterium]
MPRTLLMAGVVVLVLAIGCVLPSDRSGDLRIAIDSVSSVNVDDTVQLSAVSPQHGGVVRPSDYVFTSRNPNILDVSASGVAVAKDSGRAWVVAQLRFAGTPPESMQVFVGEPIQIASVTSSSAQVYFSDTLEIHGVGLNPAKTTVTIGGLPAVVLTQNGFTLDQPQRGGGSATLRVLVPPVPSPALVTARRGQAGTTYLTPLTIFQGDRLEPNDSQPAALGILNQSLERTSLVLEGTPPGHPPARDWYTFQNPKVQPVTVVLKADGASIDEVSVTLSDTLDASGNLPIQGPHAWGASVGSSYCNGTLVS